MATAKRSTSGTAKRPTREQVVPVRVVKTSRPRRPAPSRPTAPTPVSTAPRLSTPSRRGAKGTPPPEGDRRMFMWAGVAVAAAVIFVVWIAIVRFDLARPGDSDSLFGKIRTELRSLFTFGGSKNNNVNAADRELNELRERVFPVINENVNSGTFTTDTNSQVNVNSNANANANTNSSLNSNSNTNQ